MWDQNLKNMKRDQLVSLIESTFKDIEKINLLYNEINTKKDLVIDTNNKINWDTWYLKQIEKIKSEIETKNKEIWEIYTSICKDTDEEDSYNTLISSIYDDLSKKSIEIKKTYDNIFWYTEKVEWQEDKKIIWYSDKIKTLYDTNKKKYDDLLNDIETRLKWWATSLELAETFSNKVKQYRFEGWVWSIIFLIIIILLIGYFAYITKNNADATDMTKVWTLLIYRLPLIWFTIWLLWFIWNRRAESKKLEESYKHKETLARSYVWYRKSVEELTDDDNKLLEEHMTNLLKAISIDSSNFIDSKWENHPFLSLFLRWKNNDNWKPE